MAKKQMLITVTMTIEQFDEVREILMTKKSKRKVSDNIIQMPKAKGRPVVKKR
jgi:hypothetical protein